MKKVLVLALGMLLIPFTAFGMQMMADSDMESITAQSGVAISLENVQVYNHMQGEEVWFETSGNAVGLVYEDDENYSYLFVTTLDFDTNDPTNPKTLIDGTGLARGNYAGMSALDFTDKGLPQDPRVLTIRVNNTEASDSDDRIFFDSEHVPYVEIGLPTLELYSLEGSQEIMSIYVIGDETSTSAGEIKPLDEDLGTDWADARIGRIHSTDGGSTTAVYGGRIGITAYGNVDAANINSEDPLND